MEIRRTDDHRYLRGQLEYPSVTRILERFHLIEFNGVPAETLAEKSVLGTKVHLATQYWDERELDLKSVGADVSPYLDAWILFREETGFEPDASELVVYSERYRYAGKVDRVGCIGEWNVVLDIKTAVALQPAAAIQLAAYQAAIAEMDICYDARRLAVQLRKTGDYAVTEYQDPGDFHVFQHALSLWHWKENHS